MRSIVIWPFLLIATFLIVACVDPEAIILHGTNDILVVDGTITDRAESQIIKLNRSQADRLTGRFGTVPVTKATVEIVVDSVQRIPAHETVDGSYQMPSDFRGQIGHSYQLRFTLNDGTKYISTQQVMQAVPPIAKVSSRFNTKSLSPLLLNGYTAGHDIFIESQDPADQHNFYRWDWTFYERQYWCRKCQNGVYAIHKVLPHVYKDFYYFVAGNELYEDCFSPPPKPAGKPDFDAPGVPGGDWYYDYPCRNDCWQIFYSYDIQVFNDAYTNGGLISQHRVAQIPLYDYQPGLVDIRQLSLTADAYRYYKLFQDQTQNTGGLGDTPPTALGGNVHQEDNQRATVVGYFTASAVSLQHYWLDRKDYQGVAYGALDPDGPHNNVGDDLFFALNLHLPNPEPPPPYQGERLEAKVRIWPNTDRPPTAPCLKSDSQTPFKPEGWRD